MMSTTTTVTEQPSQPCNTDRRPTLTKTYELYTEQELIDAWESGNPPSHCAISFLRFESIQRPEDSGEYTPTYYDYHGSRWEFTWYGQHLCVLSDCRDDYQDPAVWDEESQCYRLGECYQTVDDRPCLRFLFAAVEVDEDLQGIQQAQRLQGELNA